MKLWKKMLCATFIVSGVILWLVSLTVKNEYHSIAFFGAAMLLGCYGVILIFHDEVSTTGRE